MDEIFQDQEKMLFPKGKVPTIAGLSSVTLQPPFVSFFSQNARK